MKREIITAKVERPRKRADFLFNDGEFRPRSEKKPSYKRKDKHRNRAYEFA